MVARIMKYKKYILELIVIIFMISLFISMKNIMLPKNKEEIDKKINETNKKQFAMYIEDGESYKEYKKSDVFPEGYYLNVGKSQCEDYNGNKVDASKVLSSKGNSITVKSRKTIYCTLYFDSSETGEKDHPYRIEYIEDLMDIQVAVNNGETYAGKYFELTRDLDFQKNDSYLDYTTTQYGDINGENGKEGLKTELTSGTGWKPIGVSNKILFQGNFNGNNNTISNLYIKNVELDDVGLFYHISNSEINNLTISGEITTSVNANMGAFAAMATNVKMNNCHNEVNITSEVGRYQVGGIVGIIYGTSEITNCTNSGNISNGNATGGIIGNIGSGATEDLNLNVKIENCENKGTITNSIGGSAMGGILGRTDTLPANVTITNGKNYGLITTGKSTATEQKIGGIMGVASTGSVVTIENCDNYGNVISEYNSSNTSFMGNGGGILGRVSGDSKGTMTKIINSNNHGEVNGMRRGGGIVGQVNSGGILYVDKSYNEGKVISNHYINYEDSCGGIAGFINNGKAYILNTYNKGNVTSQVLSASGIIGNLNSDVNNILMIINSYNIGNITNNLDKTSGIVHSYYNNGDGYVALKLNNVYTAGTLNGTTGNYGVGNLGTNTQFNGMSNVYHLNNYTSSNITVPGVAMKSMNEIKNQTFVDLLNNNKKTINLNNIDSSLSSYTLCNWKLGNDNYPTLNC